jgi:hypothetical protein
VSALAGTSDSEACGGDPFGVWSTPISEISPLMVATIEANVLSTALSSCAASGEVIKPVELRFRVMDEQAHWAFFADDTSSWEVTVPSSCKFQIHEGSRLYGAQLKTVPAATGACGTSKFLAAGSMAGSATLSRSRNKLILSTFDAASQPTVAEFSYCVTGDTLQLQGALGQFSLRRFRSIGQVIACDKRAPSVCASVDCKLGLCTGGPNCFLADNESRCMSRKDCAWSSDACTGKLNLESCSPSGRLPPPGCTFLVGETKCEGSPVACQTLNGFNGCSAHPGCRLEVACVGNNPQCNGRKTQNDCEFYAGCKFQTCTGDALPCESRTPDACENTSECKLRVVAP